MASIQILKARIRSVKSTKQITKAMQLVSASKMRRTQDGAKASSPYALAARRLLTTLSMHASLQDYPLFKVRTVKKRLLIAIASDRGLAGAYNSNIIKLYADELKKDRTAKIDNETIAIGRKIGQFATRLKGVEVSGYYENIPDRPEKMEFRSVLSTILDKFLSGEVDAVDVVYTKFISGVSQEARLVRVLPAGFEATDRQDKMAIDALYEPDVHGLIDATARQLVGSLVYQAFLDAKASEHSMRMMAMKNATDNATDLIDDLTLEMNKARQGAITQELAEISGGMAALND